MGDQQKSVVLVVDDDEAGRYTTAKVVRSAGFEVVEAVNGSQALERAKGADLVVLDINLPDINGFEVCRRLKADPSTKPIPVLHLTAAYLGKKDKVAGLEGGADGYLAHPVEPEELLATIRALTRLRKSEQDMEREARQWHATFEAIHDAICLLDIDGRIVRFNQAFQVLAGARSEDIVGRLCHELMHGTPGTIEGCPLARVLETGVTETLELRRGEQWLSASVDPVRDENGRVISYVHLMSDITERRRAEAEHERLMAAVEQAGEVVVITDPEGLVQYVNPAFEKVTGYSRAEVMGQNPRLLKSGAQDQEFYRRLWQRISSGQSWQGTLVNRRKDGSLYTEEATFSPVSGASGRIVNYVAVKRDITGQRAMEEQLRQAQKMETVGQLAGGVAHDFNNMLQVIISYAEMSLGKVEEGQGVHRYLLEIRRAAQRSAELTGQLLAFARKQTVSPKVVDLNEAVAGTQKMIQRMIGEEIELAWVPGHGLWKVRIDPAQLDQVLANLAVNARDAIGGVGRLTIETKNLVLDEGYCAAHVGAVPGEYAMLAVSDNGCGMDKETMSHLFEPFFTTKEQGKGTGLGLSTVYGVVKQNSGFLTVYSEPGEGTTFKVYLPRVEVEEGRGGEQAGVAAVRGGTERVLVVEDEGAILELARESLEELGYTVVSARTPKEALEKAGEQGVGIELLITDVVMPQMNGKQLYERLREGRPGLRCLYMSGYTAEVIAHRGVLEQGVSFMGKPFSLATLAAKVREVLDASASPA